MTTGPRNHLTAWLGIIAMWLIVLAPVVSQLVVAARYGEPVAALCTATASSADTQHAHGSGMIACGYCDLLATHCTLPTVTNPLLILVMLVTSAALPILSSSFTPLGAFPTGRPRAPPILSPS
jgi:Protein of unknown function (DUF2946)